MDARQNAFASYQAELFRRQLSNCENFDKAILTYASGALALSLGFLKDFIPLSRAALPTLLHLSWFAFASCILVTVTSYLISQRGINRQLQLAERYYLNGEEQALREVNHAAAATEWFNLASGVLFCIAVVLTTIFVSANAKEASVSNKISPEQLQKIISGETRIIKAAVIPPMASIPAATPSPSPGAASSSPQTPPETQDSGNSEGDR